MICIGASGPYGPVFGYFGIAAPRGYSGVLFEEPGAEPPRRRTLLQAGRGSYSLSYYLLPLLTSCRPMRYE